MQAGENKNDGPDRREFGLACAVMLLAPLPVEAQQRSPASNSPQTSGAAPAGTALPARIVRLRAEIHRMRLGTPEQAESTLFRLVEIDAGNKPVEVPFPVIRAREGEPFALEIENALDQPIAFHLRGIRGANAQDGMPGLTTDPVPPGGRFRLIIGAGQPGTFILAPSIPASMPEQNARGLHAAVIVEERQPQPFDHDLVLAVSDWRLDDKGVLAGDFRDRRDAARVGRLGNRLAANGAPAPGVLAVRPGARLRVRMINVSNARMIPLRVSGFPAEVYSIDSTPCQPFDPLKRTVTLAPASRIEMALQAAPGAGSEGAIEAKIGNGVPIFRYRTEGEAMPARDKPPALPDPGLPPAIRLQDATRVECVIAGGIAQDAAEAEPAALERRFPDPARVFTINGAAGGFSGKPLVSLRRGRVLVMALVNRTAWPQVIAVHGHAFRLLHAFDDGWEPYFLDTLYLQPGTTARIALIADNPGKWAIRSTVAEHYAAGVATWFEVT